jgi:tRNA-dihydrouridine synthase B
MTAVAPTFFAGDLPVYGNRILSPMAGFSDVPFRAVCRTFGSAMHYTEFVAAEALQGKRNGAWRLLDRQPDEYPVVFQIFGNDAQVILNAALNILPLRPDIIDVNMGCSTRRVSGRGAGVGMMRNPALVAETFRLLSAHLPVPVTAKLRLGWEKQVNYLEIARIVEDNGAALIALHARTKEQKYGGKADWDAIARLKQTVSVPVIGNGDVRTPADAARLQAYTGCEAVMIGRGARGNPWIFAGLAREEITLGHFLATINYHLDEMLAYYGEHGLILFRKHLKRYFRGLQALRPWVPRLMRAEAADELRQLLGDIGAFGGEEVKLGVFMAREEDVRLA